VNYLDVALHVFIIWTLAAITPGANVLLTMNTALKFNRFLASWAAFGVGCAVMLWGLLGASGLLIVLNTFPWLFDALKILGGGYLIFLGLKRIISTRQSKNRVFHTSPAEPYSIKPMQLFRLAFITSLLNPKTGLFVLSLFAVSMPSTMTWELTIMTMILMGTISLIWHLILAFVFSRQKAQKMYRKATRVIDYATGGLFTIFGMKIITS